MTLGNASDNHTFLEIALAIINNSTFMCKQEYNVQTRARNYDAPVAGAHDKEASTSHFKLKGQSFIRCLALLRVYYEGLCIIQMPELLKTTALRKI
jgi:hypothetical protein